MEQKNDDQNFALLILIKRVKILRIILVIKINYSHRKLMEINQNILIRVAENNWSYKIQFQSSASAQ